ncbi:MAG: thioredoxin domain-containing protein [Hyphomicrobium sp.]|uniref:thioredoxin fold domain-containing protein n=1 Tax=Hyphomicrobium sp. TaxID=82 RepID=UPI0039E4D7CF
MRPLLRTLLFVLAMLAPVATSMADVDTEAAIPSAGALELIVVEAEGCIYCKLFRRDVLPTYQASEQAKDLPVRFVDINDVEADHLSFKSEVDIVPTFVVVKSQQEVGRISGYVGPENFFHSISYLLASAP